MSTRAERLVRAGLAFCAIGVACAAALAACGASEKRDRNVVVYAYPECPAPEGENRCPGEAVFLCALDKIAQKHNVCATAEDCVAAEAPAPAACIDQCARTLIHTAHMAEYGREAQIEADQYCLAATCVTYLNCPRPNNAIPGCVNGRCTWVEGVLRVDGGGP